MGCNHQCGGVSHLRKSAERQHAVDAGLECPPPEYPGRELLLQ
jgi:hypothetical protein